MKQPTMMGKLLNKVRFERDMARGKTESLLWKRNKLDNPAKRDGYKLEHTVVVGRDAQEATKIQLWKLVDEAIVVMDTEVTSTILEPEDATKGIADLFE